MKEKIVNPANAVTLVRLVIGLFSLYFVYLGDILGFVLFLAFVMLDLVDGFLARRLGYVTLFGKHFDFTVDIVISSSLSLLLLAIGRIPLFYAVLMFPPILMQAIGIYHGIHKVKTTFIHSSWKKYCGIFGNLSLFIFILYGKQSSPWVYLILIYFYIWGIKYNLEINRFKSA